MYKWIYNSLLKANLFINRLYISGIILDFKLTIMNYPVPSALRSKQTNLLLLFVFLSYFLQGQYDSAKDYYPPSEVPDRIMLTITGDAASTQGVTWRTDLSVKEAYGQLMKADASPDLSADLQEVVAETTYLKSDKNESNYHSVNFTGLLPNTQYAYRIGDKKLWSEWFHFKTAGGGREAFSFLYFGDAQNDLKSRWSRVVRGAYSKMPDADFLLHAGDLINRANSDHEWGEWFYSGGWIFGMMPSIATPGNHEYGRNSEGSRDLSAHWRPTFALPSNGPAGLEETVYYFDYHNARIISLNSQAFLSYEDKRKDQLEWLEKVLSENKKKWTILTMHHPVYSSAAGRDNEELKELLVPLFEKYKVDLVLQGHDHTYGRGGNLPIGRKRLVMDGPVYVVSVSGPKMYVNAMEEWMQRAASNTQLYQLIKVEGNTLKFEAYMVTGELYDAFDLVKKSNKKTIFREKAPDEVPERLAMPPRYEKSISEEDRKAFQKRFRKYKASKSN